jgi:hypothetical protein
MKLSRSKSPKFPDRSQQKQSAARIVVRTGRFFVRPAAYDCGSAVPQAANKPDNRNDIADFTELVDSADLANTAGAFDTE